MKKLLKTKKMVTMILSLVVLTMTFNPISAFAAESESFTKIESAKSSEIQPLSAVPSYQNFWNNISGSFQLARIHFSGNRLNVAAAATTGDYGNATSVTIKIIKKDWLGLYSQVITEKTIPVDGNGYSICAGTIIPTNQEIQITATVNGSPKLSTVNLSITATTSTY